MSAEDNVELDTQTEPTEEVVNTEVVEEVTPAEGSQTEDKEPQYTEYEKKMFGKWKVAEAEAKKLKAELAALKTGSSPKPAEKQAEVGVSLKDQYALLQAQVPADDIDEVLEYAKFKKISVAEALKSPVVKATLQEKQEQRKTAEATSVGPSKRSTPKLSDEQLEAKGFEADDMDALAQARINAKKAQLKK